MSTNPKAPHAPQPPPTDPDVFQHGVPIWLVTGPRSQTTEDWVQGLARATGLRMDWRQIGGRAVVLVFGDRAACERGRQACADAMEALRDQYVACPYNWSQTPERTDVTGRALEPDASIERSTVE
jgi:hypothetical protein